MIKLDDVLDIDLGWSKARIVIQDIQDYGWQVDLTYSEAGDLIEHLELLRNKIPVPLRD
jgi:hypothetical protein